MIDDYIHYYCVYTAKLTLASQGLLCTNSKYMRPRVSKELFLLESEKLPLWHFVVAPSKYPLGYSGFLKCHGYEFIFKNENLLDRKGKITFMIFASIQIILCDGANSYVDANAWDEIQGFHVYCLYLKLEWSS